MKYCNCAACKNRRDEQFWRIIDAQKDWKLPIRTAAQTAAQVRADNEANDDGA